jgi:hypothetical protein
MKHERRFDRMDAMQQTACGLLLAGRPGRRPDASIIDQQTAVIRCILDLISDRAPEGVRRIPPPCLGPTYRPILLLTCAVEELVRRECSSPRAMLEFHTEVIDTVVSKLGPDAMNALFRILVDAGTMGRTRSAFD